MKNCLIFSFLFSNKKPFKQNLTIKVNAVIHVVCGFELFIQVFEFVLKKYKLINEVNFLFKFLNKPNKFKIIYFGAAGK